MTHAPATPHPAHHPQHDIAALKDRLLIPEVWRMLGLAGQPAVRCRSPFRPDKTPSFSLYNEGRRWKDFATNEGGDVIDFIATARQTTTAQALRLFLEMAGVPMPLHALPPPAPPTKKSLNLRGALITAADMERYPIEFLLRRAREAGKAEAEAHAQAEAEAETEAEAQAPTVANADSVPGPAAAPPAPTTPASPGGVCVPLTRGTPEYQDLVARTRRLSPEAVSLALALRTLTFAAVQGFPSWVLTDDEHRIAEARRLDGLPFPEAGPLAERKAHTVRGSSKSWPVGTGVLRRIPNFRTLLLVEGGPDYLAALHFACELERWDVLPIAMLGRGTGTRIDPAALELMRGRRVRLYPHADADGGGEKSARLWATQLLSMECSVDLFDFSELRRTDGKPINDLNDCTEHLDPKSTLHLRKSLLPAPDLEVDPPF